MSDHYIPGACNIGKSEIRRRQIVAIIGGLSTFIGAIEMVNKYSSKSPRLLLFIPALVFAIGWVQSRRKFCLAFGFMGVFNFGKAGEIQKVRSEEEKSADRATANSILLRAVVIALAITALIYIWP